MPKSPILAKVRAELQAIKRPNEAGFLSLSEAEIRAIRRAARKWPQNSLAAVAARNLRNDKKAKDGSFALNDAGDMFWIKEALCGVYWAHGIYRL